MVSKQGVRINLERVDEILTIGFPKSRKEVQSFLGKRKILERFIPNFVEIVKDIIVMLKKNKEIK